MPVCLCGLLLSASEGGLLLCKCLIEGWLGVAIPFFI
jgi:hypothetical protein